MSIEGQGHFLTLAQGHVHTKIQTRAQLFKASLNLSIVKFNDSLKLTLTLTKSLTVVQKIINFNDMI